MRFERVDKINPFEIAIAEKTFSPLNFMRMLLKVTEIAKNKGLVAFIKEIIKEIKEHVRFSKVSHRRSDKKKYQDQEKVSWDYYDIEKTKTYDAQLKALFMALGVTDAYLDPDRQKQYMVFREFFSKEELKSCKLSERGMFVIDGREYKLMGEDEYQKYEAFEREYFEKYGVDQDARSAQKDIGGERYYVVKSDNNVYSAYEKEILGVQKSPAPTSEVTNENEPAPEAPETPVDTLDTSYRKVEKSEQKAYKSAIIDMAAKRAADLAKITVNFTVAKSLVLGETKNGIYVRMPHTYVNQDDPLRDAVLCIPKNYLYRRFENGGLSINMPMNALWFRFNDKNDQGKFLPYINDTGEPERISALSIIKSFDIGKIRSLTELDMNPELFIDGQAMHLIEENGFKFAYNSERAVVLGYTGDEKELLIPPTIRAGGLDIPVKEIKDGAFKGNSTIETVTFSDNLNEVCTQAFAECPNLKQVYNGYAVKSWGDSVFIGCPELMSCHLNSYIKTIGINIFENCPNMSEYVVRGDNGLLVAKDGILYVGADNLYSFPLHKDVDESFTIDAGAVLENAFKGANIPAVTFTGECHVCTGAFEDCKELKEISVNQTIKADGKAFFNAGVEQVDESKVIGGNAFEGCPLKDSKPETSGIATEPTKSESQVQAPAIDFSPDMGR